MAFHYKNVVPWGRSFEEYCSMFDLKDNDFNKKILGCGDGPAGFNSEMTLRGCNVISIDPIYCMNADDIEYRIHETYEEVISQTYRNQEKFIWEKIRSVEELGKTRMRAMRQFLMDFEKGKSEGRYIPAELPVLPFKDEEFDIALSSHFLFLHAENLSLDFHIQSVREMLRVAKEVRIFPLLNVNGIESSYVDNIRTTFKNEGKTVEITIVPYEFQIDGNKMLRIF